MKTGVRQQRNVSSAIKKITQYPSTDSIHWIQVERSRAVSQFQIPLQVHFYLEPALLTTLQTLIRRHRTLLLPSDTLVELRNYVLFNIPIRLLDVDRVHLNSRSMASRQFSLIFTTSYSSSPEKLSQKLIRSVIDLEGKISQQIHQELWDSPTQLAEISQIHYWLIHNILEQLDSSNKLLYLKVRYIFGIVCFIVSWLVINLTGLDNVYAKIFLTIIASLCIKLLCDYFLRYKLKKLLILQIIAMSNWRKYSRIYISHFIWKIVTLI